MEHLPDLANMMQVSVGKKKENRAREHYHHLLKPVI